MNKNFLQTKDWARFQEAFGRKVFWIGDKLVVKFDLPLGKSWLYCPRADITGTQEHVNIKTKEFYRELKKIAQKENSIFAKIEPRTIPSCLLNSIQSRRSVISGAQPNLYLKQFNNLPAPRVRTTSELRTGRQGLTIQPSSCLQPQDELILDITEPEEKLREQMHQKTRYNIRLAEKHGIKIKISTNPGDIDIFYNLAIETSGRNKFRYHSRKYYQKMVEVLSADKSVKTELLIAYFKDKPVAVIILLYYNETCYYLHGASSNKHHNLMGTFLLQWEAIKRAKKKGCKWYNLGGVMPQAQNQKPNLKNQNENLDIENSMKTENCKLKIPTVHPWSGITRFKLGFAPPNVGVNPLGVGVNSCNVSTNQILHHPDCFDIVYQPALYWIYKLLKKIKN